MPFSLEMLLNYFAIYNDRIWPAQWAGFALGLVALLPLFRTGRVWSRVVTGTLAFLWLWIGLVFWVGAARQMAVLYAPAALFVAEAALCLYALYREHVLYDSVGGAWVITGCIFIAYALVGYPLVGLMVGHEYPQAAISPLFPCPAIVLTFGVFLLARRVPWYLLVIPTFWALSGILWFSLGMVEDVGLVIAGVVGVVMLIARERISRRTVASTQKP